MFSLSNLTKSKVFRICAVFLFSVFSFKLIVPITQLEAKIINSFADQKQTLEEQKVVFVRVTEKPISYTNGLEAKTVNVFSFPQCAQVLQNNSETLISQPDIINLNYPASCFNLDVQYSVSQKRQLAVKPLEIFKPILVVINPSRFVKPYLSQPSGSANFPVVPMVLLVIEVGFFYSRRGFLKNKAEVFIKTLKNTLDLEQLQMLRC